MTSIEDLKQDISETEAKVNEELDKLFSKYTRVDFEISTEELNVVRQNTKIQIIIKAKI